MHHGENVGYVANMMILIIFIYAVTGLKGAVFIIDSVKATIKAQAEKL